MNDIEIDTFDFITVQLYEGIITIIIITTTTTTTNAQHQGYSHALYNISQLGVHPQQYIYDFVHTMDRGWNVNFNTITSPFESLVRVPHTHLIIGLANGWAGDGKFLLIDPDHLKGSSIILILIHQASTNPITSCIQ